MTRSARHRRPSTDQPLGTQADLLRAVSVSASRLVTNSPDVPGGASGVATDVRAARLLLSGGEGGQGGPRTRCAHRGNATGRELSGEFLRGLHLQSVSIRYAIGPCSSRRTG